MILPIFESMKFIINALVITFFISVVAGQTRNRDYNEELRYQNEAINSLKDEINSLRQKIQLYSSKVFIGTNNALEFGDSTQASEENIHKFTLASQKSAIISPQKLLKKFSLESTENRG